MIGRYIYNLLNKQSYTPSMLGILVNPLFIIRYTLFKYLKSSFKYLSGKVLDFGCGFSPYKNYINCDEYIRVDIASMYNNYGNLKNDIIYYDGKTLPFNDEEFDSIFCTEVLEHIPNIDEIVSELYRVLKHKGIMLISVPFTWDEHEVPNDFRRFTQFGIKLLLEKNGFNVINIKKTTKTIHTITQLLTNAIFRAIFTHNQYFNYIINFILIFPLNLFGLMLGWIISDKKKRQPLNIIVLAEKI